jgi:hypothetical protein
MEMQVPTWLKPAIMGAVAGGIATMIVGFNYGGWYLGSSAETLANKQSNAASSQRSFRSVSVNRKWIRKEQPN